MRVFSLLLLLGISQAQEKWTILPLGLDRYSIQTGVTDPQIEDANTTTVLFSVLSGSVTWYGPYQNVTTSQLGSSPNNTGNVQAIAVGIYGATVVTDNPALIYYGGSGASSFICNQTIFEAFSCYCGGSLIVTYGPIGTENPDTDSNVQLPVSLVFQDDHPQLSALRSSFLSVALSRAQMLRKNWDGGQSAVQNNSDRITRARAWGGGVMFLIAVAMEATLVICVTLHSWVIHIRRFSKSTNFLIWLFLFFASQQVVSIVGGFPGWLAMFIVLCLYIIILVIVYGCLRMKATKAAALTQEQQAAAAVTTTTDHKPVGAGGLNSVAPGTAGLVVDEKGTNRVVPTNESGNIELGAGLVDNSGAGGGGIGSGGLGPVQRWTCRPEKMGSIQSKIMIFLAVLIVLVLGTCLIVFYVWHPLDYALWDRLTAAVTTEFAPDTVNKSTLLMYMFPRMATIMQFNTFCIYSTSFCGYWFNRTLTTDDEKKANIYDDFIGLYGIDMSDYARPNYQDYTTVNDWFTRTLRPGARLLASPNDGTIAISPADCRMVAFENINSDLHVWLKGEEFDPASLLNVAQAQGAAFAGGTMVVARLAPADYHRFHSPVNALVKDWTKVTNTLYSVNADGARSGNKVYFNTRQITILNSPEFGSVAYVAIGATCVGSVVVTAQEQTVAKGDELGIMQFGGSTVVLLFAPGTINIDSDILLNSRRGLETRVLMGARIGSVASSS